MSISALPAVTAISPLSGITPTLGAGAPQSSTSGTDFAAQISKGLDTLQGTQDKADNLALQAATGQLANVHDYTIAATEAALATKLTVAVRNKALEAFNEIMRMQA
ncbi:MAG: flagellar hook-basal body complex protein FliE [Micromonosporaceae bacterium]|nr:flagellar hook-basal body complex protein FliE [Micromonosporaceae bacterium]